MTATFGPTTPWPTRWVCDVSAESPTATGRAALAATQILWAMSAQRFGTLQVKLRPCRRTCRPTTFPGGILDPWPGTGFGPLYGGGWSSWGGVIGAGCADCGDTCSCSTLPEILLPAPVNSIVEVKVDGVVLTGGGAQYRVDDNRLLVRTDGLSWPYCQNLLAPDTAVNTLSVTALFGEDVPAAAEFAVGELACEYLRAMQGDDCTLPANITSLARQGVTISLPDLSAVIDEGRLGLRMCDLWLHSVNPAKLTGRSRVYSVDGHLARRVGT